MDGEASRPKTDAVAARVSDDLPRDVEDVDSVEESAFVVPEWNPQINIRLGWGGSNDGVRVLTVADRRLAPAIPKRLDLINVLLGLILVLALGLRVVGTDWDQGGCITLTSATFWGVRNGWTSGS